MLFQTEVIIRVWLKGRKGKGEYKNNAEVKSIEFSNLVNVKIQKR